MSPIDQVSSIIRFPRLGVIKLGEKKAGQKGPYPVATEWFVCPSEVQAIYGDKPTELDVMFPADDYELVAPQYYKCYSYSQGRICKGDGKTCLRKVDTETGDFANRDTKQWAMADAACDPAHCPMIGDKQCKKMMTLQLLLPEVPGLGIYQLNTSSFYSIVNVNSQLSPDGYLRKFTKGRIAYLPLVLSIGPQVVTPPGVGRKTIHTLSITAKIVLSELIRLSHKEAAQVLLPVVEEQEPPEDQYPEEVLAQAEGVAEESAAEATGPPALNSPPVEEKAGADAPAGAEKPPPSTASIAPQSSTDADWDKLGREKGSAASAPPGPGDPPVKSPEFKTWGHFCEEVAKYKVMPSDCLRRAGKKRYEEFTSDQ